MMWTINTVTAATVTFEEVNFILVQDRWKRFKPSTVKEQRMIGESVRFGGLERREG